MLKIMKKSLSGFLAFLTVFSLLVSLSLIPSFAAEEEKGRTFADIWKAYYTDPDYTPENYGDKRDDGTPITNPDFTTEENRIAAMKMWYADGDFQLYVDEITGEVALKDTTTGDILFTNPYNISEYPYSGSRDIPQHSLPATTKAKLLSQVIVDYTSNNTAASYNSFTDAALLGQIDVKRLRGGVRIEYSIGEEEARMLIPRVMSDDRFQTMICDQLRENVPHGEDEIVDVKSNPYAIKVIGYYTERDPSRLSKDVLEELAVKYPKVREHTVWIFDEEASYKQKKSVERFIKTYCPLYTFEELDKDHRENSYTEKDKAPANFKMALEYKITKNGLEVRFPANGLSFDESNYKLSAMKVLPYMGAGSNDFNGYLFIPDGSGTLVRFEDVSDGKFDSIAGKVYGEDYAYQEIGNANREVFRMPVFGVVVSNETQTNTSVGLPYNPGNALDTRVVAGKQYSTGYVAVITEGDALSQIISESGGNADHHYNSVYCSFNPRPKDSYNLADAISVGGDGDVTVVSKRKYTGSFKINYIMLTDPENPGRDDSRTDRKYYDTTYIGMAKAYRDYLDSEEGGNILERIKPEEVKADIPLFVETFGASETDESILSIPVTVKQEMTSFDDLRAMVDDMNTWGVTNINFRLTGYTNGGMIPSVPTKVKFEKVVGGNDGYRDFLKYAADRGIGVYPEFDFAYMSKTAAFDGFNYDKHAVKTIDNRYISKREYNAVLQTFDKEGKICISPCVFREFFEKFDKSMTKLLKGNTTAISLGSLGSDINSDFDEDAPYNREDAKVFTTEMLSQFEASEKYGNILVDAGNSYAIKYADVILNAPLDSSRYENASEAIPFYGMVYHGYLVFAGSPTNMAGDIKYEMLKILENGATLFVMLSYQNVEMLKEDEYLSRYYAISYDIWRYTLLGIKEPLEDGDPEVKSELPGLYEKLNNALKGVQTSTIDDHFFIDCIRELTQDELDNIDSDAKRIYRTTENEILAILDTAEANLALHNRVVDEYAAILAEYDEAEADRQAEILEAWAVSDRPALEIAVNAKRDAILVAYSITDKLALEGEVSAVEAELARIREPEYLEGLKATETAKYDGNRQITDGSVVCVEYENGTYFVLNYNNFVVNVEVNGQQYRIEPKDFVQGTKA